MHSNPYLENAQDRDDVKKRRGEVQINPPLPPSSRTVSLDVLDRAPQYRNPCTSASRSRQRTTPV